MKIRKKKKSTHSGFNLIFVISIIIYIEVSNES